MYSPIVLFAYNRPDHTKKVLDALAKNIEAIESDLYVFIDGPKISTTEKQLIKIHQTKQLIHRENRFKNIFITESDYNKGLSKSIIFGVSDVIEKRGKIIVLEDDIVPSIGFLAYMNLSLIHISEPTRH